MVCILGRECVCVCVFVCGARWWADCLSLPAVRGVIELFECGVTL